jgi:hypothetical protein
MSTPGRSQVRMLPLGGTARSAKGAPISTPGRPKCERPRLAGQRAARGVPR